MTRSGALGVPRRSVFVSCASSVSFALPSPGVSVIVFRWGLYTTCLVSRHRGQSASHFGGWVFPGAAGWCAGGLVVAGGVDCELAQDLAGGGVGDLDGGAGAGDADGGPGVAAAEGDVVAGRRPSWLWVMVPFGPTRPVRVVEWRCREAGAALGAGGVGGGGGFFLRSRERWGRRWLYSSANWASWFWRAGRWGAGGWRASQRLRVWWKRSTLPWVWGWFGLPFLRVTPRGGELLLEGVGARDAAAAGW